MPKTKDPQMPREYAQMKQPDEGKVRSDAAARMTDKMRSASSILTSGSGVKDFASTEKKTLLGA
jgi:hypothetical protein